MKKGVACYTKDYPRPQMVREDWVCLNGEWQFSFDDENIGETKKWYELFPEDMKIIVPFTYETYQSGIDIDQPHRYVWYQRKLDFDSARWEGKRVLLHFEGSDYLTKVWVNGRKAGEHKGGYTRFTFDITNYLKENDENKITVKAEDSFDIEQPRGKQRWREESFRCWYTQTTGIWKSVWLEPVNEISITSLKMTPRPEARKLSIDLEIDNTQLEDEVYAGITVYYEDKVVNRMDVKIIGNYAKIDIDVTDIGLDSEFTGIHSWSPENPCLYDIDFKLYKEKIILDYVASYFGMREIKTDNGNILLNGSPLYQKLILDQGYWENTGLTPPSEEALKEDIEKVLELGFNGVRKHQKIEDERFLYWCDVMGLLVWCEAPSTYMFGDKAVRNVVQEWTEIVSQNYNHPSIIVWTAFNESWGINEVASNSEQQHFTESVYHLIKAMDSTRPVIANDGWEHTVSDIITFHDYEEDAEVFGKRYTEGEKKIFSSEVYHNLIKAAFAKGYQYQGQPVIISEYGGIALENEQIGWGYGNKAETSKDYIRRFDEMTTTIKQLPYVCGYCYTQLTDVHQEINGIMGIKRNYKVNPDTIRKINERRVSFLIREEQ